jgi:Tol biopolymer transport system component
MSPTLETIPGAAPSPLVEFPAFQREYASPSLAWSPSGDQLAFVKADGCVKANVYVYDFVTASIRQVTDFTADEQTLSHVGWSADASSLLFGYSPSRTVYLVDYRIWTHTLASDSSKSVTVGRYDGSPAWVTNRDIVFVRYTNSPRAPEIRWLTLGTPPTTTQLTFDGKIWKSDLAVSRDGHWIAYSGSGDGNGAIYVLSAGGGASRKLTRSSYGDDIHPAWHPDGRTLYFASRRSGHYEIWSVDSATGSLRQITRSQVRSLAHFSPAVTADGTRLACFASRGSLTDVLVLTP